MKERNAAVLLSSFVRPVLACVMAAVALLGILPVESLGALPFFIGETATTTQMNELMKITFDDTVIPEVVTDTEFLSAFPDGEVVNGSEGRYFETSQLYQNPGSIGSRGENGYIPTPSSAAAKNARINLKKIMGSVEETAEVMKKIRGSKAAFLNWAKERFPHFRESLADELDRQAIGDSSGVRARVNMATPGTNLVVDSAFGVAGYDHALMQFRRGMFLRASPNANGSSPRSGVAQVNQIDWANDRIVIDSLPTSTADNDFLFEGDAADNSAGKDCMGALGMIDDGGIVSTLQNIDRTVDIWFQSYVHDAIAVHGGGTALSETVLIRADREARFRGAGKVDLIIVSEEGFDTVWNDLRLDRSINDPRSYTGGREGIDILFSGTRKVNLRTSRKLPSTLCFGIQKNMIRKFVLHEWEWDDTDGSIWKQVTDSVGRKDAFFAYGSLHMELGISSPQRMWRVENWVNS